MPLKLTLQGDPEQLDDLYGILGGPNVRGSADEPVPASLLAGLKAPSAALRTVTRNPLPASASLSVNPAPSLPGSNLSMRPYARMGSSFNPIELSPLAMRPPLLGRIGALPDVSHETSENEGLPAGNGLGMRNSSPSRLIPDEEPGEPSGSEAQAAAASLPVPPMKPRSLLGRIGHVLGEVGGYGLSAVSPGVAAMIPETPLGKAVQEDREVAKERQEAKSGLEGAEASLDRALAQAKLNPKAAAGETPTEKMERQITAEYASKGMTPEFDAKGDVTGVEPIKGFVAPEKTTSTTLATEEGRAVEDLLGQVNPATGQPWTRTEAISQVKKSLASLPNGNETPFKLWLQDPKKFAEWIEANKKETGLGTYAMVRLLTEAYRNDPRLLAVLPQIFKQMGINVPAGIVGPPPGQPREASTGAAIGTGMPEAPTATVRTRGQMAQDVLGSIPRIDDLVSQLDKEGKLGPGSGRVSDFMSGKIGANDPDYRRLHNELETLATSFSKLHLNTEQGLKPFYQMLDSGKMTADNLRAGVNTLKDWAEEYRYTGSGNQPNLKPNGGGAEEKGSAQNPFGFVEK